ARLARMVIYRVSLRQMTMPGTRENRREDSRRFFDHVEERMLPGIILVLGLLALRRLVAPSIALLGLWPVVNVGGRTGVATSLTGDIAFLELPLLVALQVACLLWHVFPPSRFRVTEEYAHPVPGRYEAKCAMTSDSNCEMRSWFVATPGR